MTTKKPKRKKIVAWANVYKHALYFHATRNAARSAIHHSKHMHFIRTSKLVEHDARRERLIRELVWAAINKGTESVQTREEWVKFLEYERRSK